MADARRYIVMTDFCNPARACELCRLDGIPRGGVLMLGDAATVFPYTSARRAIERTKRYADSQGFDWGTKTNHWLVLLATP